MLVFLTLSERSTRAHLSVCVCVLVECVSVWMNTLEGGRRGGGYWVTKQSECGV